VSIILISAFKEVSPSLIDSSERESELLYSFASSEQLVMHVLAYAEVLFRWKLLHKRIELLKAVDPFLRLPSDSYFNSDHSQLGTLRHLRRVYVSCPIPLLTYLSRRRRRAGVSILCTQCSRPTASRTQSTCSACGTRLGMPRCSVCRLPVKGASCHPTSSILLFNKTCSHRPLLQLLGMSSRQPSILLEVAPERHLLNWLSMPLPCHSSGLVHWADCCFIVETL
jgi:hypothetical protein